MTRFEYVKRILDEAIEGQQIGAHGAFWRGLTLDAFKARKVYGRLLVTPGSEATSNLVLALRGQAPFGSDTGTPGAAFPRMPVAFPAVPEDRVAFIERWITDGCPDEALPDSD